MKCGAPLTFGCDISVCLLSVCPVYSYSDLEEMNPSISSLSSIPASQVALSAESRGTSSGFAET